MRKFPLVLLLAALGVITVASPVSAYGPLGHQIVGGVADQLLTGTPTEAKIKALLDGMTLEKASVIPDEIKGWDKKGADDPNIFHYTSRPRIDEQLRAFWRANQPTHDVNSPVPSHHWFHYTDVPVLEAAKYADGKTGRSQWDIVHMMNFCVGVLRGTTPEDNDRKITKPVAVILLAHFVGDIHQPLHVGAEYFNAQGKAVNPDRGGTPPALADEGGNTIMLQLPLSVVQAHKKGIKLHGFWDNDAVVANLPTLPETMPKEERRAQNDAAEAALIRDFATHEPGGWRLPATVPLTGYAEAWANEILPVARQAHERLAFSEVRPLVQEDRTVANGKAGERPAPDGVPYRDWATRIVRGELHAAGWRLADLLEKALAPASAPTPAAPPKLQPPATTVR